jgi:HD-GYP domain-containing protein (c-di-GMP phosphodiesterase class II)
VLLALAVPGPLFDELFDWKTSDPERYQHGIATAAVATRLLIAAVGEAKALPDVALAALVHDLGMRHVRRLGPDGRALQPAEIAELATHPVLGALHLASVLGDHPAVEAALYHHWRGGRGYPRLDKRPARASEVIAVASAFVAMTRHRAFRSEPFDARGAVDVLMVEANGGAADPGAVKLLVHTLREGKGQLREIELGRQERRGRVPELNRHTPIEPEIPAIVF